MAGYKRSERVALILRTLMSRPGTLIPLGYFANRFDTSKPTISEDVAILRRVLQREDLGTVETVPGAIGGVRYLATLNHSVTADRLVDLASCLSVPGRILPGGFLYMTDVVFSPMWAYQIGELFAGLFHRLPVDYVVTVETKGIPIALTTAQNLGRPLVVVRRNARATEGPSVSINYVSGSADRLQTMSLPRRALPPGSRCLCIDDFMRAGGTARGITDLVEEVEAQVVGTGVLVETEVPTDKLIGEYVSLLKMSRPGPPPSDEVLFTPGPHYHGGRKPEL